MTKKITNYKIELSSASHRKWNDGMMEYWNDGMAPFGQINAYGEDGWGQRFSTNQKLLRGVQGGGFLEKSPPGRRRYLLLFLFMFFGVFLLFGEQERERGIDHELGKTKVTVVPDMVLRGYDPITVFFPGQRGPAGGGPVDRPGDLFRLTPGHPGETRWVDGRTLQFLPTTAWPALERYTVQVEGREFRLSTFMAPPRQVTPADGSQDLEPVKEIYLSFPDRMDLKKLAGMITVEVRPLPGVSQEGAYWLTDKNFVIKEMERRAMDEPVVYLVTFHKALPYGMRIILHLRLSLEDSIPGSLERYAFSTRPLFRLVEMGSGGTAYPVSVRGSVYSLEQAIDCGTGQGRVFLRFSDEVGPVSLNQVKQMVRFDPAVRNFRFEVYGKTLELMFDADRERPYQFMVRHVPIKSSNGRELAFFGPGSVYFFYRESGPYLKWLSARGILERYGPQVFPMEGRGMEQVDLRVYKINPLDRNFWPFPSQPVAVDESRRPPGPGEEPAYATAMREQIRLLGSPLVSRVVPLPLRVGTGMRFGIDLREHLAGISGSEAPGTYLVGYRPIGAGTQRFYVRVQVTDLSLSTVEEESAAAFVVTSLKTGQPVGGAEVKVEGILGGKWKTVFSGVTGANGIYRYQHTGAVEHTIERITISSGRDMLVLDTDNPPPHFMNNHWYSSYNHWLNWLNSLPRHKKSDHVTKAHILTERPVYRPEEVVHIKGYVQLRQQGTIKPDTRDRPRSVVVRGPGGKQWTYPVKLTPYGSFYHEFSEKDLPSGEYIALIQDDEHKEQLAAVDFKKESYRIPRFEVKLSAPDRVPLDQALDVTLTAGYYAGGPVVGQSVAWQVTQFAFQYRLPGFEGFLFSSNQRISGERSPGSYGSMSKTDVTDENGTARLTIDPNFEEDSQSRKYVVEATVRGADEQTVTSTCSVLALSPYVLGIKLDRFLRAGMTINPQVVLVGHDGKPLAGKTFHLRLLQRQWHSYLQESDFTTGKAKYVTDVVDKAIFESDYVSEADKMTLSLPIKEAGVYVVELTIRDKYGRLQTVQADLYAAGDTAVAWKKPKANVFETTADRTSYNPGDTAAVLLKSPFQEAHALVVVEGPTANTYHWVQVKQGQGIFQMPINGNMHPRLPVHFLLMRGRLPGSSTRLEAGQEDRAKPIAMANTIWLQVKPRDNQLELTLNHPQKNLPGAKMKMEIKMTDPQGRPLDGEVTLWLVDRAVLALGREKPLDPLPSFIDPVNSMLRIRETRNEVVGNLSPEEVPGGDGSEEAEEPSIFEKVTVRKTFKSVPYFNPGIRVQKGTAVVEIQLPDNLTDFAVRAVATDGAGRFGAVKSMVSIRLPLIVQPALPRFVRPGDQFTAGGIGRVVEGEGGPGRAELQVKGLDVKGDTKTAVSWVIGQPEKIFFPFSVPEDAAEKEDAAVTVRLAVKRDTDQAMDAFELQLPVKPDKTSRRIESFVTIEPGKLFSFPSIDEGVRPGTMTQTLVVTPEAALVKMLAALNFLARYEHGCTEQRISKLLPQLALADVMNQVGREINTQTMKNLMAETFTYLESCLKPNGLYSVWPGSTGYVSLTAYVVEFLLEAKKLGCTFKPQLLERGIAALKESLRTDYRYFISGYAFVERAEALTALGKAGYFDEAYGHDLMVRAMNMDLYSEANILYTFLTREKPDKDAVKRLGQDLWRSLVFKLRDGKEVYDGLQYRSHSWGGLILSSEIKTMAALARALYKAEPANPRIRLLVNELVNLGTGDGWGSTNANAAALLALKQVLDQPQSRKKGYQLQVNFGSDSREINTKDRVITRITSSETTPGTFKLLSNETEPPLAWLSIEYVPAGTGDQIKTRSEGFVVTRELLVYKDKNQPPDKINAEAGKTLTLEMGTVVEEHIRVINSEERFYVAVQAPFAAGFEPLNPNLATAPPEAKPSGTFTRNPDYALYADDAVTFYFDTLPKGTYDFYFRLRASIEGSFTHPPAKAELMYQLAIRGNSDGMRIKINPRIEQ
jgi:uncharacterized protein YfaS (alpha-2-macroglobulin family)